MRPRTNSLSKRSIITLLLLFSLPIIIYLSKPYPTEPVNLAIGQHGSSYETLGRKIAEYFAKHGLKVNLIETSGMDEAVSKLDDDASSINAAFMNAGQKPPKNWSGLVSMGSVQYTPIWLIYRNDSPENELDLFKKRIAIGADGTNTQSLFKALAKAKGYDIESAPNLLKAKHSEAVSLLNEGKIDAVFMVDGISSENVQHLIKNPDNNIFSFELADAYTRQMPYLNKLSIPQGSLDLAVMNPRVNKTILATTTTLLVEENTHPYIQWLLLKAVRDISNEGDNFFAGPNFFPAQLDTTVNLSEIADRYYERGFPELTDYMPWWVAIYFDRIWILVITALAIIIPIKELWSAIKDLRD